MAKTNRRVVQIDQATVEELREYAIQTLGDEFPEDMGIDEMRATARQAEGGKDQFTLIVLGETKAVGGAAAPKPDLGRILEADATSTDDPADEFVSIIINQDENDPRPVQAGCNGKAILIPRGEMVRVRRKYVESLSHAVKEIPIIDARNSRIIGTRRAHLYPFQVLGTTRPDLLALAFPNA